MLKKEKDKVYELNRADRRNRKSSMKSIYARLKKKKIEDRLEADKKAKHEALKKRIEKNKKNSELRNNFRKEKAKELGVNWRRVRIESWNKDKKLIRFVVVH